MCLYFWQNLIIVSSSCLYTLQLYCVLVNKKALYRISTSILLRFWVITYLVVYRLILEYRFMACQKSQLYISIVLVALLQIVWNEICSKGPYLYSISPVRRLSGRLSLAKFLIQRLVIPIIPRNLYTTVRSVGTRNTLIFSAYIGLITITPLALYIILSLMISNIKSLSFINVSLRLDYNI